MNVQELKDILRAEGIEERYFSAAGQANDESFVIEMREGNDWHVYYSEHGQRTDERYFSTESEACTYILSRLRRVLEVRRKQEND